jgi:hypothetical protein
VVCGVLVCAVCCGSRLSSRSRVLTLCYMSRVGLPDFRASGSPAPPPGPPPCPRAPPRTGRRPRGARAVNTSRAHTHTYTYTHDLHVHVHMAAQCGGGRSCPEAPGETRRETTSRPARPQAARSRGTRGPWPGRGGRSARARARAWVVANDNICQYKLSRRCVPQPRST